MTAPLYVEFYANAAGTAGFTLYTLLSLTTSAGGTLGSINDSTIQGATSVAFLIDIDNNNLKIYKNGVLNSTATVDFKGTLDFRFQTSVANGANIYMNAGQLPFKNPVAGAQTFNQYYSNKVANVAWIAVGGVTIGENGYSTSSGSTSYQQAITSPTRVGEAGKTPDAGWKRYDDLDSALKYVGAWGVSSDTATTNAYKGGYKYSRTIGNTVSFRFTGDRIRMIAPKNNDVSSKMTITIDGVPTDYSINSASLQWQILAFEKDGIPNGEHTVQITCGTTNLNIIDAIDISATGRVLHPDEVTNPKDLAIGKRIRCNYKAPTSGAVGVFSAWGTETKDFIPAASSATPDGDFYLHCVDTERWSGRVKLMADRPVAHSISWDTLNSAGLVNGVQLLPCTVDLCTGGTAIANMQGYNGKGPANAFDNNVTNGWDGYDGLNANGHAWIGYDFGEGNEKHIRQITLNQSAVDGRISSVKVQKSTDNVAWTDVVISPIIGGQNTLTLPSTGSARYWRLLANSNTNVGPGAGWFVFEIEMMEAPFARTHTFTGRLPTGGIDANDKDNEWDNYVVNSTLNGAITAGDNAVWNWNNGVWNLTSTTNTTGSANRTVRGYSTVGGSSNIATNNAVAVNTGYRPMFIIEALLMTKFLVDDGGSIKTVDAAENWVVLGSAPATEDMFQSTGFDLPLLTDAALRKLGSCKLLVQALGQYTTNKLTFVPKPALLKQNWDISMVDVVGIDSISVASTLTGGGIIRIIASKDSGTSWFTFDGAAWVTVNTSDLSVVKANGIAPTALAAITPDQWSALGANRTLRFAYYLELAASTDTAAIDQLLTQMDIKGSWRGAVHGSAYDYEYGNNYLRIYFYVDGTYKINYSDQAPIGTVEPTTWGSF